MRKQTVCLAFVLVMITAPLAASDRPDAPLAGLWAWVLELIDGSANRHGSHIIDGVPVDGAGPGVRGKHGSHVIIDGSAAPVDDPPIDDGSTRHGSHGTVDG